MALLNADHLIVGVSKETDAPNTAEQLNETSLVWSPFKFKWMVILTVLCIYVCWKQDVLRVISFQFTYAKLACLFEPRKHLSVSCRI